MVDASATSVLGDMECQSRRQCCRDRSIGSHQERGMPLLQKHWPTLALAATYPIFNGPAVPLCR